MKVPEESRSRRNVLKGIAGVGAAGLAGCLTSDESGSSDSITFWEMSGSWQGHMERYGEEAGVSFEHSNMGYDEIVERLQTRILAGNGAPDVAMLEYTSLKQVSDTGGLRDISGWLEEEGVMNEYPGWIWEVVSSGDKIYEVPYDIGPTTLFYRKDVWDEHGLSDDIQTYDQLIEEGQKLPDDVSLLSLPASEIELYWRIMYRQLGGQEFDEEGRIAFDNDKALQTLRQIQALADSGITSDTANWSQQWFSALNEGTITGYMTGAWFSGTLMSSVSESSGNWRGMKIPAFEEGGNRASNRGGSGLCFPRQADDESARAAFDFAMNTNASVEEMVNLYQEEGNFAAYKPAWENEAYSEPREFFGGQPLGEMWVETANDIPPFRYTVDSPTVTDVLNPILQNVAYGDLDPETALDQFVNGVAEQTGREIA